MAIKGIQVPIISTFNGKGTKDAAKSLGSMETAAQKLGSTLKKYLGAAAIEEFTRRSVDAFVKDQQALALLDKQLLALGLGFQAPGINDFIAKMSEATGIMKENLIPAFETLARYTKNAGEAQTLLQLALDISKGTGKDLSAVSTALGKAYAGQTTALGRLGTGLSKATLASSNFATIQKDLTDLFAGTAATAADTYQGKIDKLKVGFHEMEVTIGQGLVQAFSNLSGSKGSIEGTITFMQNFGYAVNGLLSGFTMLVNGIESGFAKISSNPIWQVFDKVTGLSKAFKNIFGDTTAALIEQGKMNAYEDKLRTNTKLLEEAYKQAKQNKILDDQANAAAAKAAAAAKKAAQDKLALEKASATLKSAGSVVDVQQAQIVAALMSTTDPQIADRLKLQQALLNGNADAAGALAQKILEAQKELLILQGKDPFSNFNTQPAIDQINDLIKKLKELGNTPASVGLSGTTAAGTAYTNGTMLASGAIAGQDAQGWGVLAPSAGAPSVTNNYNIGGSVISERALSDAVANNSASGISQNITRLNYNFGQ